MNLQNYEYKTEPYQHQTDTLELSLDSPLFALFLEMGLGKSKILLDNAALLFEHQKISGLLIVSPKGNLPGMCTKLISTCQIAYKEMF